MRLRLLAFGVLPVVLACPPPNNRPDAGQAQPPTVTAVSPSSGPMMGGTTVTITGSRFADGATVKFGEAPGVQVVVQNALRLTARTPAVTNPGRVSVTVTNPDGTAGTLPDAFTFEAGQSRTVTEAVITNPATTTDRTGTATVMIAITAQVEVPMVTRGAGQGMGVRAQVGFAATLSSPPAESDFTWTDATYSADADGAMAGDLARDVYGATVSLPGAMMTARTFRLGARFSADNGVTWKLADRDGSANGVQEAQVPSVVVEPKGVDWCRMGGQTVGMAPPSVNLRGTQPGPVIYAQVFVSGRTEPMGSGMGVRGQIGYGMMGTDPSTWTWVDGAFNTDVGNNDEWQATLPNPGIGTYRFAWRFNLDNGSHVYCDNDGLAMNGFTEDQSGTLTVTAPGVDSCVLQFPNNAQALVGNAGPLVYGRVFAGGITDRLDGGAPPMTLTMELGIGPGGVQPDQSSWTWQNTAFNVPTQMGGGAEYQAALPASPQGTYAYAFRARLGTTGTYTYCDLDGSQNGFQTNQAGVYTVAPFSFTECRIQFPASLSGYEGRVSDPIFAQVFAPGVTSVAPDAGAPMAVEAQLGFGPNNTDPQAADAGWAWTPGAFNVPVTGGGAEYQARLTSPTSGTFHYAWRVRYMGGAWTYCDRDGSSNQYQLAQAGVYTVTPFSFAECRLQFPASMTSYEGRPSGLVYGQLFAPGVTVVAADGGAPAGVEAELGFGPQNSSPQLPDAGWAWTPASFNTSVMGGGVEYQARLTGPTPGSYHYAYRARHQGSPWQYCDRDGAANGYQTAQAGALTAVPIDVEQCFVDTVAISSLPAAPLPNPFAARVKVPTITDVMGTMGAGLTAQIGYGPQGSTPSTWTTWTNAAWTGDALNDFDSYNGAVSVPGALGTYDVAFRFRVGANAFVYCDRDGSQNGYSAAQASRLVVANSVLNACQLVMPSAFSVESGGPLTASVTVDATGTSSGGQAPNVRAQIGFGPQDDASQSPLWGWGEARYAGDMTTRDIYRLTFNPSYIGLRAVSARVSVNDGATWTYCDLNGSDQNGYEVSQQYNVTVTRHTSLQFCKTQFPATVSIDAGTTRVYGQVFQAGLTPDAGAPIRAEFGIGARNNEPALAWSWNGAAFLGFGLPPMMNNNNEYFVDYRPDGGNPNYAFRFSQDDGGTWCYADNDGNGANGSGQAWDGFRGDLSGVVNLGEVRP